MSLNHLKGMVFSADACEATLLVPLLGGICLMRFLFCMTEGRKILDGEFPEAIVKWEPFDLRTI